MAVYPVKLSNTVLPGEYTMIKEALESTCPVCEGWNTEETDIEYQLDTMIIIFLCHHCKSEWKDIYRFDTSRIIKEVK